MAAQPTQVDALVPKYLKFAFGGTAGVCAVMFTQPLDLVKNRMQMSGEGGKAKLYKNTFDAIKGIIRNEGPLGLYNGLSAGALRQATYTTARLGFYTWMLETFSKDGRKPNFAIKAGIGLVAGGTAAFIGTPAEISLIRMTLDGKLPAEQKRNYKNAFQAIYRIAADEGVMTLWRGCFPTVLRAMVVNAAQLATYSQAKQTFLEYKLLNDNIFCHFCASMVSGFATTVASMPVDIAKTRIQNMRIIDGKPEYKNAMDVWLKVMRSEGIFSLWKGFTPYFLRLGPHTVLVFVFLEQINRLYCKHYLKLDTKSNLL